MILEQKTPKSSAENIRAGMVPSKHKASKQSVQTDVSHSQAMLKRVLFLNFVLARFPCRRCQTRHPTPFPGDVLCFCHFLLRAPIASKVSCRPTSVQLRRIPETSSFASLCCYDSYVVLYAGLRYSKEDDVWEAAVDVAAQQVQDEAKS